MKQYYLLSTEHLENALWFRDNEDFATGMNYVAIQSALNKEVTVLVFILMSNHVHFILYGTRRDVETFMNNYKCRYSLYLNKKYGLQKHLRRNSLDIRELPTEEHEALERAMAYVQMNCVAANICLYPGQYHWGTGSVFFGSKHLSGQPLGALSGRKRVRLMHSEDVLKLPDKWRLSEQGFVLPESYVDVKRVESIFRSPRRMQYFLNSSSKVRKRLEAEDERMPAFRDQVILSAIPDLLQSLFHKGSFVQLSQEEQSETLRQLRYRFNTNVHQLARVCGLSYADAAHLMDTV